MPIGIGGWTAWVLAFDFNDEVIKGRPSIKLCERDRDSKNFTKVRPGIVFSSFEHLLKCFTIVFELNTHYSISIPLFYDIDPLAKPFWKEELGSLEDWDNMDP